MNKITEEEIIQFLKEETCEDKITSDTDIFNECGVSGDDCIELLEAYQNKFDVNMTNYLWHFHCTEEGMGSIGGTFFKPPNERVEQIPITPKMLTDFANSKMWKIDYPKHTLPKKRYDLLINQVIFSIILIWLIFFLIKKYF